MRDRPDTNDITLDEKLFVNTLDEYYTLRGLDITTGKPTAEKLDKLTLRDVHNDLKKRGLMA